MTNLPDLRRDRSDAKVAGVCAALARSWNVDPLLVRVGFVVLALVTNGFAGAAYLALAVLIPERGSRSEPVRDLLPFTRAWTSQQLVAAVVAAAFLVGLLVSGSGPGALVVALLVLAIMRWGRGPRPTAPPPPPPPRSEFERLSQAWTQRQQNVELGLPPEWSPEASAPVDPDPYGLYAPDAAPPVAPPPARRRRGVRTWSGVAVGLGLAWGGLGALQASGTTMPWLAWTSATLAVLALGLVVVARPTRARYGRPPGLLAAALLAAGATVVLMTVPPAAATVEPRPEAVRAVAYTASTLPEDESFGMGSRTVDLSGVVVERDRTVRLAGDVGRLRVLLPAEGNVVVRYRVDLGQADVAGRHAAGTEIDAAWSRVAEPGRPTLTLDLAVDVGSLEVVAP